MADDGILINFDLGSEPLKLKETFKGGRWKDRLSAKKFAQRKNKKTSTGAPTQAGQQVRKDGQGRENGRRQESGDFENPPAKRQRIEDEAAGIAIADTNGHGLDVSSQNHNNDTLAGRSSSRKEPEVSMNLKKRPRQIVSSLFSFNPKATTTDEGESSKTDNGPVEPSNAPLNDELETFLSLGLSTTLAEHLLRKLNIKAPTGIQRAAMTHLSKESTDAFIQAETGSGKTLAYLLPIVQRLMSLPASTIQRDSGLFAIILAPTRELSKQISVVLEELLRCAHWIVSGTVIGGEKKKSEKARLRKGLNVLIATPGRLVDHLENTEVLDVSNVRWLVLDEGDRLMELGFEDDLRKIMSKLDFQIARSKKTVDGLPAKRTTILCSATMKTNVQKLGELSLKDAVHIHVAKEDANGATGSDSGGKDEPFSAPAQLQQSFAIVPAKLRLVSLTAVLKRAFARRGSVMKVIVFMSCADSVDFHFEVFTRSDPLESTDASTDTKNDDGNKEERLQKLKLAAASLGSFRTSAQATTFGSEEVKVQLFRLHGSLPQAIRTSTLSAFSRCKDPAVLVCTDVAARGLDLPNIDFVIEYDPPFNKDDHLHRIGRTARAGKDGRAMIFLLPGNEEAYIPILKESRHDEGRNVTRHESRELLQKGFGSAGLGAGRDWEERATEWQLEIERWALEAPAVLEQARRGFQSHVRAYATHIASERHIFDMTSLHLGHLAKAFALRDRPGSIKVPGLRPNQKSVAESRAERRAPGGQKKQHASSQPLEDGRDEIGSSMAASDANAAAEKMRAMVRQQQRAGMGASEFNLG